MGYAFTMTGQREAAGMAGEGVLKARVRERLEAMRLSANKASRLAGLGISYANDLLSRDTNNVNMTRLAQLAQVLECDPAYLMGDIDTLRAGERPRARTVSTPAIEGLPLLSTNLPDADGWAAMDSSTYAAPSFLAADPDAYAVAVPDNVNAPRFSAGETVIVSPRKPVAEGRFCVIRATDGRYLIRRVDMIAGDEIKVSDLRSGKQATVKTDDISTIHRIVAVIDL